MTIQYTLCEKVLFAMRTSFSIMIFFVSFEITFAINSIITFMTLFFIFSGTIKMSLEIYIVRK